MATRGSFFLIVSVTFIIASNVMTDSSKSLVSDVLEANKFSDAKRQIEMTRNSCMPMVNT